MRNSLILLFFVGFYFSQIPGYSENFFVDSKKGNDLFEGRMDRPWKSFGGINGKSFSPGDTIFFKRGSFVAGNLFLNSSGTTDNPIVLTAYGKGESPRFSNPVFSEETMGRVIEIEGCHVVIDGLSFCDNTIPSEDIEPKRRHYCVTQMGAVFIHIGSDNNVVQNCEFSHSPIGIRVRGEHNLIRNNYLHDADSITYFWGSIAIVVVGAFNEIAYNQIKNYGYYGGKFGMDGAAIEMDGEDRFFDAHDINIHHNVSINTKGGFMEITGRTKNIKVAFNVSDDIDKFIGVVGVDNLQVLNNTVTRVRSPRFDQIVFWDLGKNKDSRFNIENNLFYTNKRVRYYDTPFQDWGIKSQSRNNNLYFSPDTAVVDLIGVEMDPSDFIADPKFINLKKENYCLQSNSPAIPRKVGAYLSQKPDWKAGVIRKMGDN